jgi:hypothetical protein
VQETLPRSTKQEEDLGARIRPKKAKGVESKADVARADVNGEDTRHQAYTRLILPFFNLF